ncbi:response regulator transcription factor [Pseudoalteromonas peptidolytica]|uniref:response regulator transcription factor n=1 Tax=Pseudoalteromonas peptidolytica TaxID=61150 RepID=UPI00298DD895|nr:response regulator transcription factor [Pseudoalteromonas peptidolytica]MDW7548947.1 response regulator transcription factor [Pseudoalteromonas peptidolytica]
MKLNTRIIYVEDEQDTADIVSAYLEHAGYCVTHLTTHEIAKKALYKEDFDLAILDIMLPDGSGLELLQSAVEHNIPSILLSAKKTEAERIEGFRLGADDYVCKPFSPRELTYRVKALLNRLHPTKHGRVLYFNGLQIDPEYHTVTLNDNAIRFTSLEFALLYTLASNAKKVFSRDMLITQAWPNASDITDRAIDTHIANLRKKLNDNRQNPCWIQTIYGQGYQFIATPLNETTN